MKEPKNSDYHFKDVQRSRQINDGPKEHTGKAEAVQAACLMEKSTTTKDVLSDIE